MKKKKKTTFHQILFEGKSFLPALLQSTVKLLLWPTKALLRPGPRLRTLLASESPGLGMELKLVPLTGASRVSIDVSFVFVTLTSRGPEG